MEGLRPIALLTNIPLSPTPAADIFQKYEKVILATQNGYCGIVLTVIAGNGRMGRARLTEQKKTGSTFLPKMTRAGKS
jgi:hypothetical protein